MTFLPKVKLFLVLIFCCWVKISDGVKSGALIPCSKSDPKMATCLMKVFPQFIATFDKENPVFPNARIRDPQKVGTVLSKTGDSSIGLSFKLTNAMLYGQLNDVLKDLKVDLKRRELTATIFNPKFEILSDYEMSGKVLLLPITGKGKGNITSLNTNLDITFKWDLVKRDGATFVKSRVYNYKMRPGRTYLHFDNLFNGDKYLGSQMNQFMNENYKDLNAAFLPVFEKVLADEDKAEVDSILNTVSYENLLLD